VRERARRQRLDTAPRGRRRLDLLGAELEQLDDLGGPLERVRDRASSCDGGYRLTGDLGDQDMWSGDRSGSVVEGGQSPEGVGVRGARAADDYVCAVFGHDLSIGADRHNFK
jgi:hypothetical protein